MCSWTCYICSICVLISSSSVRCNIHCYISNNSYAVNFIDQCSHWHHHVCFVFPVDGEDFTPTVSPEILEVVFPAGTTDGTVLCDSLNITNDDNLEGIHQFSVHITRVTADLMNQVTINPTYATVEISDDEGGLCTKCDSTSSN